VRYLAILPDRRLRCLRSGRIRDIARSSELSAIACLRSAMLSQNHPLIRWKLLRRQIEELQREIDQIKSLSEEESGLELGS